MKVCYALSCLLFAGSLVMAQNPIPNPGFESWNGGEPIGWSTGNIPGFTPITQSSNSHSGASAMRGEVLDLGGNGLPPSASTGDFADPGFPVTQQHMSFGGWHQYAPQGSDELFIQVFMLGPDQTAIGSGQMVISAAAASYTQFSMPITYFINVVPDTAIISVLVLGGGGLPPTPGSTFLLDDLEFDTPSGIGDTGDPRLTDGFVLEQNYPNPFNPATNVEFEITHAEFVTLTIYDVRGKEVVTLVSRQLPAGHHQYRWDGRDHVGQAVDSGVYFYRLTADRQMQTRKMMLLR